MKKLSLFLTIMFLTVGLIAVQNKIKVLIVDEYSNCDWRCHVLLSVALSELKQPLEKIIHVAVACD